MIWGTGHCRRLTTWRDRLALLIGAKTSCSCPRGVCYPMGPGGDPVPWTERRQWRWLPPALMGIAALMPAPATAADIVQQAPITFSGSDFARTAGVITLGPGALSTITGGLATMPGGVPPLILGTGAAQSIVGTFPSHVVQIWSGSAATPQTAPGPALKVDNYTDVPYANCGNNSNAVACNAALSVNSTSGPAATMVTAGIQVAAQGSSSTTGSPIPPFGNQSPDVFGISAKGLKTGGTGIAAGIYAVGHRLVDTAFAEGAEISSWNQTNTDCPVSYVTSSWCNGVLLTARGNAGTKNSSALQTHDDGSAIWAEGLTFNQGSIATVTYNDQSSSLRSIVVGGAHSGGAIIINQGAGFFGVNAFNPQALIHMANAISLPAWGVSGAIIRQDAMTVNDTSGSGTIGFTYLNALAGPILANVNPTIYTNVATLFVGPPANPGGAATITNKWSVIATGNARFDGPFYLKSIIGQTQCLQADSLGLVSGIPQPCGGTTKAIGWSAGVDPNLAVIYTAWRAGTVVDIRGRVATPVGATAQATVYKAASGTPCPSGVAQHGTPFTANGTAAVNQSLALVGGAANQLAAGDSLCLVTTGTWLGGLGNGGLTITVQ